MWFVLYVLLGVGLWATRVGGSAEEEVEQQITLSADEYARTIALSVRINTPGEHTMLTRLFSSSTNGSRHITKDNFSLVLSSLSLSLKVANVSHLASTENLISTCGEIRNSIKVIGQRIAQHDEGFTCHLELASSIVNFCALLDIEKSICEIDRSRNSGWRGDNVRLAFSENVHNTFNQLVGRIFVVAEGKILETGSGIIVDSDRIITCRHVVVSDYAHVPPRKIYFVRANALNPETGLPSEKDSERDIIDFLTKEANKDSNNSVRAITPPQFEAGIPDRIEACALHKPFTIDPAVLSGVIFHREQSIRQITSNQELQYFSLGYPTMFYYCADQNDRRDYRPSIGPLVCTSTNQPVQKQVLLGSSAQIPSSCVSYKCGAPTAAGMSGGPVFTVEGDRVHVLGLIATSKRTTKLPAPNLFLVDSSINSGSAKGDHQRDERAQKEHSTSGMGPHVGHATATISQPPPTSTTESQPRPPKTATENKGCSCC